MAELLPRAEAERRATASGYADAFRECRSVLVAGNDDGLVLDLLRERGVERLVGVHDDAELNALTERFGGVYLGFVFDTLDDPAMIARLRACARRLEPGGVLLVRAADGARALQTLRAAVAAAELRLVGAGNQPHDERSLYVLARAPAGAQPEAQHVPIAFAGVFFTPGSMAVVNRELARALLAHADVAPVIVPEETSEKPSLAADPRYGPLRAAMRRSVPPCDVLIRNAPGFRIYTAPACVQILPWEYGALPRAWADGIRSGGADVVWTPSAYCRSIFVAAGVAPERVTVVPNGIDPELFAPDRALEPYPLATRAAFRFLFIGALIPRKGVDVLLEAYRRAFRRRDDVALVLKLGYTQSLYDAERLARFPDGGASVRAFAADRDAPEVVVVTDELSDDDLARLYRTCQAYASPYRGEGFGLPMLEALACGLPVIATAGGAADEFLADDASFVAARRATPPANLTDGWELAGDAWWLEPDVDALAATMRRVVENYAEAQARARDGAQRVRTQWTWARAAETAAADLRTLRARVIAAG